MVDSTGNAPNNNSTQPVPYIFADDLYTNSEKLVLKKQGIFIRIPQNNLPSNYHGGRHNFLCKVKDFAEVFAGLRFNNNHD
jgi:hypothetical protein